MTVSTFYLTIVITLLIKKLLEGVFYTKGNASLNCGLKNCDLKCFITISTIGKFLMDGPSITPDYWYPTIRNNGQMRLTQGIRIQAMKIPYFLLFKYNLKIFS